MQADRLHLVQTIRGKQRAAGETALGSLGLTATLFFAGVVLAVSALALDNDNAGETPQAGAATTANADPGEALFTDKCGSCHTLSAAGTTGAVGPNLDDIKPSPDAVIAAIENGGMGSGTMPPGLYSGEQAQQVADYVSKNAGK